MGTVHKHSPRAVCRFLVHGDWWTVTHQLYFLSAYPRETRTFHEGTGTSTFIVALLEILKNWNQPKYLLFKLLNKLWDDIGYYTEGKNE